MKQFVLTVVLLLSSLACGDGTIKAKYVVKVLEGSPEKVTVTFNENGSINQGEVAVPWTYKFDAEAGNLADVSVVVSNGVQNGTPFRVSVAAYRNGELMDSNETTGTSIGTARAFGGKF